MYYIDKGLILCYNINKGGIEMSKLDFYICPVCENKLHVSRLSCSNCKAEYPTEKDISAFDALSPQQKEFLEIFLKSRGNIKMVGEQLQISYPTVTKRLDELLCHLGLVEIEEKQQEVNFDMNLFRKLRYDSMTPSEIVRRKLYENKGAITIPLLDGKLCKIVATSDGKGFTSDKLNNYKLVFDYSVFDCIVELLKASKQFRAPKGNGHGKEDKIGYGKCTEDTVTGTIAIKYFGKQKGESTYDPTFVLAAILEWAEIAVNQRGFVSLHPAYIAKLGL